MCADDSPNVPSAVFRRGNNDYVESGFAGRLAQIGTYILRGGGVFGVKVENNSRE